MGEESNIGGSNPEKKESDNSGLNNFENSATLRLPEVFVVISGDNVSGKKTYPGTVGLKYGPSKDDWIRLPYTSMKKIIDFCMENKIIFNAQLRKEREKNTVSDL